MCSGREEKTVPSEKGLARARYTVKNPRGQAEIQGRGPSHLGSGQDRSKAQSWAAAWVLRFLAFTWSQVALSSGQRLIRGLARGCKQNLSSPPVLDQEVPSHSEGWTGHIWWLQGASSESLKGHSAVNSKLQI